MTNVRFCVVLLLFYVYRMKEIYKWRVMSKSNWSFSNKSYDFNSLIPKLCRIFRFKPLFIECRIWDLWLKSYTSSLTTFMFTKIYLFGHCNLWDTIHKTTLCTIWKMTEIYIFEKMLDFPFFPELSIRLRRSWANLVDILCKFIC